MNGSKPEDWRVIENGVINGRLINTDSSWRHEPGQQGNGKVT